MAEYLLVSEAGELPAYGYFFEDVTNAADILAKAKSGDLNMCLVNPRAVVDPFQLQVAVYRAIANRASGTMVTKSIYAEVLFCMSPSTNIIDSFRKFGVSEKDKTLIAITFDKCDGINDIIQGKLVPFAETIPKHTDSALVRKLFGIKAEESAHSKLVDSIVTRIAAKCIL